MQMIRKITTLVKNTKRQYVFAVHCICALCCTLFIIFSLTACYFPGGSDTENANAIGQFIAKKYGRFDDRARVEKSFQGKIYYTRAGRYPAISFYEVTEPEEIAKIERYARESLNSITVDRINLIFYEKQNMRCVEGNACSRQEEKLIKEIEVTR